MKREIKFRGKVEIGVKKPFWIYGDLVRFNKKSCIHSLDENGYHRYTVNSETVGQFTGRQDKNGKDIFDGDLLKIKGIHKIHEISTYKVVFFNQSFGVIKIESELVQSSFVSFDRLYWGSVTYKKKYIFEVIGNIYDNHELLK